MTLEEAKIKLNEIKKEYATMDGLKEYVEAIDMIDTEINKLKEKLLEKQDDVNVAIAQRDSMDYQFEQAKAEINKLNNIIDRMQWRPIKEYNRKDYDWVLVKYFDGDYECVPEVAEQRIDGKWYTTERELPFEVKYFFDMQILDEERREEYE